MNAAIEGLKIARIGKVKCKVRGIVMKGDNLVSDIIGTAKVAPKRLNSFAIANESSDVVGVKLIEIII